MPDPAPPSTASTDSVADKGPDSDQMSAEQLRDLAQCVYDLMLQDMRLERERGS